MNNGETWEEGNDTVKEEEQHRQMWGCLAPAAFIQENLLIIRRLCEIAIYDLQAHFSIFVQMLGIIQAMLHIFCPKEHNGRKREGDCIYLPSWVLSEDQYWAQIFLQI